MQTNNKLREALENSNGLLEELAALGEWGESAREQIAENNAALSAPARNCEVDTVEEQIERHNEYCAHLKDFAARYNYNLTTCLKRYDCRYCFAKWAQMPYEAEKEGDAK